MAGKISSLLDPSRISLHVPGGDHAAALRTVARLLAGHPAVTDFDQLYAELLARDRLDTTYLGNGVALPHARTEYVTSIVMAVGRSDTAIPFEGSSGDVRLLFVLGTPMSKPGDYLLVISALCKLLRLQANREAFLAAATPDEFIRAAAAAEEKLLVPA
jgi:mannitol/fructose-specific phosphotransferase system IIA component (Ntr-type)